MVVRTLTNRMRVLEANYIFGTLVPRAGIDSDVHRSNTRLNSGFRSNLRAALKSFYVFFFLVIPAQTLPVFTSPFHYCNLNFFPPYHLADKGFTCEVTEVMQTLNAHIFILLSVSHASYPFVCFFNINFSSLAS